MAAEFVSLHNHSDYSLLDGYPKPKEYLERAVELGMTGLGISDHGNGYGLYEFLSTANDLGITGIPGVELYMAPINSEGAKALRPIFYGPNGQKAANYDVSSNGAYLHLTVWAYNEKGLENLFKLLTMSFEPQHFYKKNRIDFRMLAEHSEGLIAATGCPSSEISTRFLLNQDDKAYEYAGRLLDIFGKERLFVEIMNHGMKNELERLLLPKQVKLAKDLGLRLLATNDSHYTHKEEALHHDELLCSQSQSRMSDLPTDAGGNRFSFDGDQFYLKSAEEMSELFPERDFPGALSNTLLVAEMAQDVKIKFNPHLKPKPTLPSGFDNEEGYFKYLINEGYKVRYGKADAAIKQEAKRRIAKEYEVVASSGFIGYFLTVYEYLKFTRDTYSTRNKDGEIVALSIGVGRGSIGGSILAYLLFISELDPIRYDLVFERFLTSGRGETYRITYEDGTTEDVLASEIRKTISENGEELTPYIHQLNAGDVVIHD